MSRPAVRIIPLGGLGEIGKNITLYECEGDMFIVDCGMTFPSEDMPGVDLVIPDITYVVKNRDKIRGIFLTHGHEDHIGALPFLLKEVNIPLYGTRLTLGLVEGKLKEHGLAGRVKMNVQKPGDTVKIGCFTVEFIHVNHSIPGAVAFAIGTPQGTIIQMGDFKIDSTPIDDTIIDLGRFSRLGREGVQLLLCDSTNAERPGYTPSERIVGASFANIFAKAEGKRIIVATFSSNVHRIQQIVDEAVRCGRKVAVSGRSMINVVSVASELGYLHIPEGALIEIEALRRYSPGETVIITTGSQGEPLSALRRMAAGDHRQVQVSPSDIIILSATPVPGNEKTVSNVINDLMKLGAEVIYEKMYDVHTSGHACSEEIKLLLGLTRPKNFMPVHGEQKHLMKNAALGRAMGIPESHILVTDIGTVVELNGGALKIVGAVQSGRVLVDGLGVGDVGSVVLRDRKHLAEDGLIIVAMAIDGGGNLVSGPDLVSRGFVYVRESEGLMEEARKLVCNVVDACMESGTRDWMDVKTRVRDDLSKFLYDRTRRSPMILPVILAV